MVDFVKLNFCADARLLGRNLRGRGEERKSDKSGYFPPPPTVSPRPQLPSPPPPIPRFSLAGSGFRGVVGFLYNYHALQPLMYIKRLD